MQKKDKTGEKKELVEDLVRLCLEMPAQAKDVEKLRSLLCKAADMTKVPLVRASRLKMEVNRKKYPAKECRKDAVVQKYTSYSGSTGVTKETNDKGVVIKKGDYLSGDTQKRPSEREMKEIKEEVRDFANDRGWTNDKYSFIRLQGCIVSEIGELLDVIVWKDLKGFVEDLEEEIRNRIASELADIFIYTLHFERVHGLGN